MLHPAPAGDPAGVRLDWRGRSPHLGARIGIALFFLPFVAAPLLALVAAVRTDGVRGAVPLLLACAAWYAVLWGMAWLFGWIASKVTRLDADPAAGTLSIRHTGYLLLGRRDVRIPSHAIREIRASTGAEGSRRPLPLKLHLRTGKSEHTVELEVAGLERREEVLELAGRIATALGRPVPRILRLDDLAVEAEWVEAEGDAEGAAPVSGEPLPARRLPPFRPESLSGPTRVLAWEPGRRVHLRRDPVSPGVVRGMVVFCGVIALVPLAAYLVFADLFQYGALLLVPVVQAPIFAGVLLVYLLRKAKQHREVVFDWTAGEVRIRTEKGETRERLGRCEALEVRGHTATARDSHDEHRPTYTVYWTEVVLRAAGAEHTLLETERARDADAAYLPTAAMAEALAAALGVGWSWKGFR